MNLTGKQNSQYVILHGDESWANQETNNRYSMIHYCGDMDGCYVCAKIKSIAQTEKLKTKISKSGKGKRMMFAHVISIFGLLNGFVTDARGKKTTHVCCKLSKKVGDDMDKAQPTAELVMECGTNKGDYHQNMDAPAIKYLRSYNSCF